MITSIDLASAIRLIGQMLRVSLLPAANEVCEGYVFTGVCLSTGVGCAWYMVGGHAWQGGCAWQRGMHGGGMHGWGAYMAGGMCGRGHAWQGACMAGGMHGRGHVWLGGMHGRGHAWLGACMAGGMAGGVWLGGMHGRGLACMVGGMGA